MKTEAELIELAELLPQGYDELKGTLGKLNRLYVAEVITGAEADKIIDSAYEIIRSQIISEKPKDIVSITDSELAEVISNYPKFYFEIKDGVIDVYVNARFEGNELAYRGNLVYTFVQSKVTKEGIIEQLNVK